MDGSDQRVGQKAWERGRRGSVFKNKDVKGKTKKNIIKWFCLNANESKKMIY